MARIVYEAKNESRKEVFIGTAGTTDFSLDHIKSSHQAVPPQVIGCWRFDSEQIDYRVMEEGMSELDVPGFLDSYMHSKLVAGWTLIVE